MRIFKGKVFARWARKERIDDAVLSRAAREIFEGRADASLGGYLFKKRVARSGGGKSGGYRTIIAFRSDQRRRVFFLYGFAKNERANISARERKALSILAATLVKASDTQLEDLKARGTIVEMECGK